VTEDRPRFIGRANVRKRLAPLEGRPGRTSYADGVARIETESEEITVRPPFGLAHVGDYGTVLLEPLLDALAEDRCVAVLLASLGGYAIGVLDGEKVVASKVGTRFVKGRHKKGGSSSSRFRRRREEQARTLVDDAAETALAVLEPWRGRATFAALGGDRAAVDAVLERERRLAWVAERALPRFFPVPKPRLEALKRLPYDLYAAEVISREPAGD
jgi:Actinobacteria/chloroflexi VLRF1 release factor